MEGPHSEGRHLRLRWRVHIDDCSRVQDTRLSRHLFAEPVRIAEIEGLPPHRSELSISLRSIEHEFSPKRYSQKPPRIRAVFRNRGPTRESCPTGILYV